MGFFPWAWSPEAEQGKVSALPSPKRLRAGRSKASSPDYLFRVSTEVVSRGLRHSLVGGEGLPCGVVNHTPKGKGEGGEFLV
jgi:hypothetical protein